MTTAATAAEGRGQMKKVRVERLGFVFRLVYRSHLAATPEQRTAALDAIVAVARAKNADLAITGALLVWDDVVVQVLEGGESEVRRLYETIRTDPRHDDVALLDADTAPRRVFADWSMARIGDEEPADIPLSMDGDAGPVPPTPEHPGRAVMLDLMREYARADVGPV